MTNNCIARGLIAIAAVMGAGGVALAAVAAHRAGSPNLGTASSMLMFQAPAIIAACVAVITNAVRVRIGLIAALGMVLGTCLFSGDLAMRDFFGHALFPMAAPSGGTIMIVSWLVLAMAALWRQAD